MWNAFAKAKTTAILSFIYRKMEKWKQDIVILKKTELYAWGLEKRTGNVFAKVIEMGKVFL